MRIILLFILGFTAPFQFAFSDTKVAQIASDYYQNSESDAKEIQFSRIVFNVPSTKQIGDIGVGYLCQKAEDYTLDNYNFEINDVLFVNTFTDVLSNANYNLAGNPNSLFVDNSVTPDLLIGAVIKDMEYDMCRYRDIIKGVLGRGENYLLIEWQIFDVSTRQVVLTVNTEGYAKTKFTENGENSVLEESFRGAVYNLLALKDFHDLVQPTKDLVVTPEFDQVALNYISANQTPSRISLEEARKSVVTIKAQGHGSGFIISSDGYILTNQHVVGNSENVIVSLDNGIEVDGQVLRSDQHRDVALVKIPLNRLKPLLLQQNEPKIGTSVYAIGSPLDTSLSGTVSQGIISSFRVFDDQEYIQSDAQINSGNSGGPMVDENGNVVAIAVSGRIDGEGVNFFIPIRSALESLRIVRLSE